jgi:glycosyltransferase involved in cell wall biosynthesis
MAGHVPRVSVIIPAFNAETYLAETLRSVADQTFDDWEVVVGDDGSTDRSVEIAEGFGPRVKVVRSLGNAGPAAARNRAIDQSTGELLAFLDADDYWLPEYLVQQVSLYEARGGIGAGIGIVACNARMLGPDGFLPETYMDLVRFPNEVTVTRLLQTNPIFVSAVSPRAVVDRAGGFCPEIFGTEDHDLWLRIVELGYRVVANQQPVAVYRLTPTSVSADLAKMARAEQAVYRAALGRGSLTRAQRRLASRKLRLQRALEETENIAEERRARGGTVPLSRLARSLPLFLVVAAEHPRRWLYALRTLAGRKHQRRRVAGE